MVVENVKIETGSFEELVLVSSVMPIPLINLDIEKKTAFIFLQPLASTIPVIYYYRLEEIPKNKFVHLNRFTGRIRFGDELSTEPNDVTIPLIKIKETNLDI